MYTRVRHENRPPVSRHSFDCSFRYGFFAHRCFTSSCNDNQFRVPRAQETAPIKIFIVARCRGKGSWGLALKSTRVLFTKLPLKVQITRDRDITPETQPVLLNFNIVSLRVSIFTSKRKQLNGHEYVFCYARGTQILFKSLLNINVYQKKTPTYRKLPRRVLAADENYNFIISFFFREKNWKEGSFPLSCTHTQYTTT